nr:hypothetical protein [Tanacetum cinerariifolium]
DMAGLSQRMTDFVMIVRQDTNEIYVRLDDAQDDRLLMSGQLNMLCRDRCAHARTARFMKSKAKLSLEAWVQSIDASDTARDETQMAALQRQQGPARVPSHPEKNAPKRTTRSTPATTITTTTTHVTNAQLKALIDQGIDDASTPATTTTTTTTSVTDAQLKVLIDQGVANALAARDADRSQNGEDNHDSGMGVRRQAHLAREYTYQDFMKCKPLYFKGIEGALTWWNSHVMTVGYDVAYAMTWTNLRKKMTDKYFPRGEIKKLEGELWNLRVKSNDMAKNKRKFDDTSKNNQNQQQQQNKRQNIGRAYTAGSGDKKPYGGSKPLCSKCNYHHDGQYAPKCHKYNRVGHLARDCRSAASTNTANNQRGTWTVQKPTCFECRAQGHFKRECLKLKNNNNRDPAKVYPRGTWTFQKPTCFECRAQGHFKRECLKLKNNNNRDPAKVYAVGHTGTNPDSNIVMGTFLLNNRYASILFDTGPDRSFVST